ncbi:MAG: IPT/TIG domain-containing protein, partial [Kofleriaceae bacterium]
WIDDVADYPREAPPARRDERPAARAGFIWVVGEWQWRANKWEWVAGHYERPRAGKRWREGRWERRDDRWAFVDGDWIDDGPSDRPREAPPAPRDERAAARRGEVFVRGRYDWRGGKWEWLPGHYERERAGYAWREPVWELRDGYYTLLEGSWVASGGNPTDLPIGDEPPPRHDWKLDRPAVEGYFPQKGKIGTRVVIRGRNFPPDIQVLWNGNELRGANVSPDRISFIVPVNSSSPSTIELRREGKRRELTVGMFDVAATFDPIAEQARIDEARRKAAEAAVLARSKAIAADRAAREAAYRARIEERAASRERRRAEEIALLRGRWGRPLLINRETLGELTLHAQRVAELSRMRDLADLANNSKLSVRIEIAQAREDSRHEDRMATLKASLGGAP